MSVIGGRQFLLPSLPYARIHLLPRTLLESRSTPANPLLRIGRSRGNLARTPDVAVVISLNRFLVPVDDTVTAPLCNTSTSTSTMAPTPLALGEDTQSHRTVQALELVLDGLRGAERDCKGATRGLVRVVRSQRSHMADRRPAGHDHAWQHAFRAAVMVCAELTGVLPKPHNHTK